MFKIDKGKTKTLQTLAKEFYSKMNPVKKSGSLRKNSLKKRLSKKIRNEKDVQRKAFYQILSKNRCKLLNEIITGDPAQLTLIQNKMEALVARNIIPAFFSSLGGNLVSTPFGSDVLEFFDYKACRGSIKFNWLVDELDVVICPYCNYTHTFQIRTTNSRLILFEFDHFIPKVIAPYLSLSFFNLIPSCHTCNSTLKGTVVFSLQDYTHPYVDDLHSLVTFSIDKPISGNDINSFDVEIKTRTVNPDDIRKSGNNILLFNIQQRYNHFKSDILRLERKRHQYTDKVKLELLNDGIFGKVFNSRADVIEHIADELDIPLNEKIAIRKEKGKFKLDIAKEFKILD